MESKENVIRKGVDNALFLFKKITEKESFSNSRFYIIGKTGAGTEYLKELCVDLNILDKVIFTGIIDESEKINYLKISKYYFQLSIFEGFGIAALEALAAKNIVIHSARGGLKDTIKNFGVIVDLEKPLKTQFDYLYSQLSSFNNDILISAYEDINKCYSISTRKKYFINTFL
jgi:glycosyltransferase involved in cell wall biosynthesis